jgi:hypothetical protein
MRAARVDGPSIEQHRQAVDRNRDRTVIENADLTVRAVGGAHVFDARDEPNVGAAHGELFGADGAADDSLRRMLAHAILLSASRSPICAGEAT